MPIAVCRNGMGTGTHTSMSTLYVRIYVCLYTRTGKYIFRYSLLAHKAVGLTTQRWIHTVLSVSQVCFSRQVPTFLDSPVLSEVVL